MRSKGRRSEGEKEVEDWGEENDDDNDGAGGGSDLGEA